MPTLFHYTDTNGLSGILDSKQLWASTIAKNPRDVRYGNGQYLTDIKPGIMTSAQLSRALIGHPFQGLRFTHFVEIDVANLAVTKPRSHVFVVTNDDSLDLSQRFV